MSTRKLTKLIAKIVSTYYQPDTGLTVTLKTDEATPVLVATGSENPASSGQYVFTFTTTPKFGYIYVSAVRQDDLGRIWLGEDGQLRPVWLFKRVEVYDSGDSPTGAKGDPKIFTTGTSPLDVDANGAAIPVFTNTPTVIVNSSPYQERYAFLNNTPSLSSGQVTFQIAVADTGENYSDGKAYADITVISLD